MQFSSVSEFIAMGGHGFYVWLSYGVGIAFLAMLVIFSQRKQRQIITQITSRQKRELKLKQAAEQMKQNEQQASALDEQEVNE